jgi:hypothetical protein
MSSRWASVSDMKKEDEEHGDSTQPTGLFPCPDCTHPCSRNAEACPQCGHFFQRFDDERALYINKRGWVWTIAVGIWWAFTLPWIVFVIILLLIIFGTFGASRK